jgi:hypothetical protein
MLILLGWRDALLSVTLPVGVALGVAWVVRVLLDMVVWL